MLTMNDVFARRAGRLAFGVVLLLGAVYLVLTMCFSGHGGHEGDAARILEWTWLLAAGAGVAVWAIAAWLRAPTDSDAVLTESLVLPTLGAALLLPLTLHLLVFRLLDGHSWASEFDDWVGLSLVITGPAHLVFAILSAVRASKLAIGLPAPSPLKIYGLTVAASCLPFVLLMAIPPVLVAITGLPILPLLYGMERLIARERAALAAVTALPRAVAIRARP